MEWQGNSSLGTCLYIGDVASFIEASSMELSNFDRLVSRHFSLCVLFMSLA